jgi:hypothetical protein
MAITVPDGFRGEVHHIAVPLSDSTVDQHTQICSYTKV